MDRPACFPAGRMVSCMFTMGIQLAFLVLAFKAGLCTADEHQETRPLGRALQTYPPGSRPPPGSSKLSNDTLNIPPASPPPPPAKRLAHSGETCRFGGNMANIPCERGLVCLPGGCSSNAEPPAPAPSSNSGNESTSVPIYGKCVYVLEAPHCNTTTKCGSESDECLASNEQAVQESNDTKISQGVCVPKLAETEQIYLGKLGEMCGKQTDHTPEGCNPRDCPPQVTIWRCDSGLDCLLDSRIEKSTFIFYNHFTVQLLGTCQYSGTGGPCTIDQECKNPLACVKNTAGWYKKNGSTEFDVSECALRGTGDKCSQDVRCKDPLVCLRPRGASESTRNGICGTWGPNAPNSSVPVFYQASAGSQCDPENSKTCIDGFSCTTSLNTASTGNETTYLFCIASAASSLAPTFIPMLLAFLVVHAASYVGLW